MRKPFTLFPIRLLFCGLFLTLFGMPTQGQDKTAFAKMTPEQLAERSWLTPSETERGILRRYLARRFPDTPQGLFATSWVEYKADHPKQSLDLLRQCLKKDPRYLKALFNQAAALSGEDMVAAYAKVLAIDPGFQDYEAIEQTYFAYRNVLKDPQKAQTFLATWQKKLPKNFIFDLIRGTEAQFYLHDDKRAEPFYRAAVAKQPDAFAPYLRLTDLRLYKLSDAKTDMETRLGYLDLIANYIKRQRIALAEAKPAAVMRLKSRIYTASLYLGDHALKTFQDRRQAFALYREAFHVYPTAEAAVKAFEVGQSYFEDEVLQFLLFANKTLPHNYVILDRLGQYYANHVKGTQAELYLQEAMANAPTEEDRFEAMTLLGKLVYGNCYFDYERERKLYDEAMKQTTQPRQLLYALLSNRIDAGDYAGALHALDEAVKWEHSQKNFLQPSYFLSRYEELNYMVDLQERARKYDPAHPELAMTSALLPQSSIASSPDGKYLVFGAHPMQVWDVARGEHIRDLGRGGTTIKFSPDSRYVASVSNYIPVGGSGIPALHVFDVQTGQIVAIVADRSDPWFFDWSPDSRQLAYTTVDGRLVLYDLKTQKKIRACRLWSAQSISARVIWSKDGAFLATGSAQDDVIRLWDPKTLHSIRTLAGVSWPHSLAQTADGRYLACADNTRTLSIWDTAKWKLRQLSVPALANFMYAHPTEARVVLGDFGGGAHPQVVSVDVEAGKIVAQADSQQNSATFAFSGDGKQLYEALTGQIRVYDATTLQKTGAITGAAVAASGGIADPASHFYATHDTQGVHVWDVPTGKLMHFWPGAYSIVLRLDDGQFLAAVPNQEAKQTRLLILDAKTMRQTTLLTLPLSVNRLGVDPAGYIVVAGKPYSQQEGDFAEEGVVIVYARKDMQELGRVPVPFATDYLQYGQIFGGGFTGADISPGAEEVVVSTWWQDGFGHSATYSRNIRVFNLKTGARRMQIPLAMPIYEIYYLDGNPAKIQVHTKEKRYLFDAKNGAYLGHDDPTLFGESFVRLKAGGQIHWTRDMLERFPKEQETPGRLPEGGKRLFFDDMIQHAFVFEDVNRVVVLTQHNTLDFYNLTTLEKERSIQPQITDK